MARGSRAGARAARPGLCFLNVVLAAAGPLFAWFGQRWRVRGALRGALATAAALCLEPLARIPTGHAIRSSTVLLAEVAVGIAMMTHVATRMLLRPAAVE